MGFFTDIVDYLLRFAGLLFGFLSTFFQSIFEGLKFVLDFFTIIPNFLMHVVFPSLPAFFNSSLYGLLGFMMFVLVAKIYFSLKG